MAAQTAILLLALAPLMFSAVSASDPSPLQDFCVADPSIRVNGMGCKNPTEVQAKDFSFSGLHLVGNTSNPLGFSATPATIPGLNTLGLFLARVDLAPGGVAFPHSHPRASEILTVIEGSVEVGFVTSNPENRLIGRVLNKGDVFVFPLGLVHFLRNIGSGNAFALTAFSSQSPGFVGVGDSVFGSKPRISSDILAKAFQVDKKVIELFQS